MSLLRILALCFCAIASQNVKAQQPHSPGRDNAIVESLLRIPGATIEAYPQHADASNRYLNKTAGTSHYLRVIGQLGVTGQESNLSAMLNAVSVSTESTQAAKLLLENGNETLVKAAVGHEDDERASAALSAIGHLNSQVANDILLETMQDSQRSRVVRTAAATALGKKPRGQRLLLQLTSAKKIMEDLEFAVADALLGSEVPEIRNEASKLVRPAVAGTSESIPPVKKLAEMRGTAESGKTVFNTVGTCSKFHKIYGEGKEVGPDLSEIGSKLSREEMFVSILNPSAAVSHNYETYSALTHDSSVLTGTLINQTDKSITIRSADAIETTIAADDLDQLKKQSVSLMPEGLHKAMPLQSLIDLVDYMVLLRKPEEEGFNLVTRKKPKPQSEGSASREPKDALAGLAVADGVDLQLFSSEPMMLSPTSMDVDHLGRVWIAEAVNYRHFRNKTNEERKESDRIIVMEDTDHDGKADNQTVFYQGPEIDSPHGVCVLGSQIIVSAGANVWVFTDDDGDLKADSKRALFTGIDGVQHDHGIHSVNVGPDGKLYFNFGNEGKRICDADGKLLVDLAGNVVENARKNYQEGMVFRCNLDGSGFETLGWNFRNNWELCLDSFGTIWQSDNDDDGNRGTRINYVMEFGNYGYKDELTGATWKTERTGIEQEIPLRHWHLNDPGVVPNLLQTGAGSPTGIAFYEGDLLPRAFRNQVIHCDPGPNVVRAYPTSKLKAGYTAETVNLVQGVEDQWFRPVDVSTAPDGSLFIADWYDPGVGGHRMGETKRGRVFRAVPNKHAGYRFSPPDFSTLEGAILALQSPNVATQYLAQQALLKMGAAALPAMETLLQSQASPRRRARVAWQMARIPGQATNVVEQLVKDSDADLRIVGIRLARQHKLDLIAITKRLVNDESPQVRRELAIALRHDKSPEMPELWAQLAKQHDGQDRWYIEALGIGADLRSDECFDAWMRLVGDQWDTTSGRDIVWRSRASKSCGYLSRILYATEKPEEQDRYLRALDFHDPKQVANVLEQATRL